MADSTTVAAPTRALIIANPASGTHSPELVARTEELCSAFLDAVTVHHTTAPEDATDAVRAALAAPGPRPDLVIAVGGDGTVREVVQALSGRPEAALFIVPGGTGNSYYRMLWGDRPWSEALKSVFADGAPDGTVRPRPLDLALLAETDRVVCLGSCSGVIADALITARDIPLVGKARYARAFADTARDYPPYPGRVTVDGRVVHEGPTVLANVGGGRYRGGQYLILPHSRLDDGLLDVCVIGEGTTAAEVPGLSLTAAHLDRPGTVYARGRKITVERTDGRRLPLEHDGEYQHDIGGTATFHVLPGALTAWAPAEDPATTITD
ncbi:diacylglycerol/lipid kinase family protein [Streptomyces sp. cmx-4-9]|uniref:diacylglycerol/lipid kinase family protein n=1 Tax=Streptomyces sp. cmx-4-9 TaxID=2790941 RepID=UPI0039807957